MVEKKRLEKLVSYYELDPSPWWPLAEEYAIEGDKIVIIRRQYRYTYPLKDPELFSSFAHLGSYKNLTPKRILRWVNKYGLLKRKDETKRAPYDRTTKELNQAPMTLTDFRAEADQAYSASRLYYDLKWGGVESLKERLVDLKENRSKRTSPLSQLDEWLIDRWEEKLYEPGADFFTQLFTRVELQKLVGEKISDVRLGFLMDNSLAEPPIQPPYYTPRQTWYCPDLLSAIYLQFYLMIIGALPMRLCDHCKTPFPLTRTDKRFCNPSCRSSGRKK